MDSPAKDHVRHRVGGRNGRRRSALARGSEDLVHSLAHPRPKRLWISLLALVRSAVRARETGLVLLSALVGAGAGLLTIAISGAAHVFQAAFYGIGFDQRLSAIGHIPASRILVLPLGGLLLGLFTWLWTSKRPNRPIDPVEANALHGGRLSGRDSLLIGVQSIISNGFGASVGLEAAYAQSGGALGSLLGGAFNLRRSDLRILLGAGAGAGIAAAFGAPLTGAFYGFEIIIGAYTLGNVVPVVAASLAASVVTDLVNYHPMIVRIVATDSMRLLHYVLFAALGVICAFYGVAIMRLVALVEKFSSASALPRWLRPAFGGVFLGLIAWGTPTTLSSGHGALHLDLVSTISIAALAVLIAAKSTASIVSLGFGYRGGLFFASLYLGSLVGRFFVLALNAAGLDTGIDPVAGSLVGMGAMAVAIIGGPLTMSFLVLYTTGDFGLTAATLTASMIASLIVRETFGYSFSTWRLHLRGETIRSAHDVAGIRNLAAGRMMRSAPDSIAASAPLE
ncbi:MAG: chloride channel protein, partial [Caulobacteraceae bacterium]